MERSELNEVMTVISDALEGFGFGCIEAEWEHRILRLYVDRKVMESKMGGEQGSEKDLAESITADDLEKLTPLTLAALESTHISKRLADMDYEVEVSSPGIERPLRRPADFERFVGSKVEVSLLNDSGRRKKVRGILTKLELNGSPVFGIEGKTLVSSFSVDQVAKAKVLYEWT